MLQAAQCTRNSPQNGLTCMRLALKSVTYTPANI